MGMKWTAELKVTFEMEDGQPEHLPRMVLMREVGKFQHGIERGERELSSVPTGVKGGSARVEIVSQGLDE